MILIWFWILDHVRARQMKNLLILVFVLSHSGCCGWGAYNRLNARDQENWQVCGVSIARAQCPGKLGSGDFSESFTASACTNQKLDEYSGARDTPGWLLRHGCPRDMVSGLRQETARVRIVDDEEEETEVVVRRKKKKAKKQPVKEVEEETATEEEEAKEEQEKQPPQVEEEEPSRVVE